MIQNVALIITAITGLVTAVGGVYLGWQQRQTHKIVNSQRTDMQRLLEDSQQALQEHGLPVPRDRSL